MKIRIRKHSLALRIPKSFAAEVHLQQNSLVDVSIVDGKIVVSPATESALTLEHLLAGVTEENLHSEVDTGTATGNEVR
jgi:antitoxin MazE